VVKSVTLYTTLDKSWDSNRQATKPRQTSSDSAEYHSPILLFFVQPMETKMWFLDCHTVKSMQPPRSLHVSCTANASVSVVLQQPEFQMDQERWVTTPGFRFEWSSNVCKHSMRILSEYLVAISYETPPGLPGFTAISANGAISACLVGFQRCCYNTFCPAASRRHARPTWQI